MTTPNQCQFWDCAEAIRREHTLCLEHYRQREAINRCPSCGQYKYAEYEVCLKCNRQPAAEQRGGSPDAALLEELRGLRRNLARTHGLQEFMVFNNDTLEQMAAMRPITPEALLAVNGVGPAKMERFGWDFIRVIRASVSAPPERESRRPAPAADTFYGVAEVAGGYESRRPAPAAVERDDREFAADKDADRFFVYILMLNDGNYYIGQTRDIHARLHEHRNQQSGSTARKEPKLQWFTTVQTRNEAADLEAELQRLNSHPASRRQITRWVTDFKNLVAELDYEPHQSAPQPAERERPPFGGVAPPSSRRGRRQRNSAYQDNMDVDDLPF